MSKLLEFVLSICATILRGYTLSIMWGWFIVTTFAIVPISVPAAIGINILAALFTKTPKRIDKDNVREDDVMYGIVVSILWSVLALAVGYVVTKFM